MSEIAICTVRVSRFRCLEEVEVSLNELTLLIGANNAGKTSFLDAVHMAVGATRHSVGKEDIHLANEEADTPSARKAVVDVLIRPVDETGVTMPNFPAGSFWTDLWGDGISQDEEFRDFVAIRTTLGLSPAHGEYRVERQFLREWPEAPGH